MTCRKGRTSTAKVCAGVSPSAAAEKCLGSRGTGTPAAALPDTSSEWASISEIPTEVQGTVLPRHARGSSDSRSTIVALIDTR